MYLAFYNQNFEWSFFEMLQTLLAQIAQIIKMWLLIGY